MNFIIKEIFYLNVDDLFNDVILSYAKIHLRKASELAHETFGQAQMLCEIAYIE